VSNRRGFALIVVMFMLALVNIIVITLWSASNTEMMIAGNARRSMQTKISATSGMNHYMALGMGYEALREQVGLREELLVIPETQLGDRTFYDVKVILCCDESIRQYIVISTGYYKKGGKVLAIHPARAIFQSVE
jgi:hypothetical protein